MLARGQVVNIWIARVAMLLSWLNGSPTGYRVVFKVSGFGLRLAATNLPNWQHIVTIG